MKAGVSQADSPEPAALVVTSYPTLNHQSGTEVTIFQYSCREHGQDQCGRNHNTCIAQFGVFAKPVGVGSVRRVTGQTSAARTDPVNDAAATVLWREMTTNMTYYPFQRLPSSHSNRTSLVFKIVVSGGGLDRCNERPGSRARVARCGKINANLKAH